MNPILLVFMSLFLFPSCAVVNHLDEATTLQDYSREQDALNAMVKERDRKFDELLVRIASGDKLADLNSRTALLGRLGEPVLITAIEEGGAKKERWLYRYQKPTLDPTKVYFVVNINGGVDRWYKVGPPGTTAPSTDASKNTSRP